MTSPAATTAAQRAVQIARQMLLKSPLYLDTETTGLSQTDEIVEIGIVDDNGETVFEALVRPSQPIPAEASRVHHITDEMVRTARPWPILWTQLKPLLTGRVLGIYNSEFDKRMMKQSMERYRLPWNEQFQDVDIMRLFADYRSEWDSRKGGYRYFKLEDAGRFFEISLPNAHRATADTLLTRAVLHCMAGQPY